MKQHNEAYRKAVLDAASEISAMIVPTDDWERRAGVVITRHLTPMFQTLTDEIKVKERELAEAREVAKNLALLCYASGCGIGTKSMLDYEAMKQRQAAEGGGR